MLILFVVNDIINAISNIINDIINNSTNIIKDLEQLCLKSDSLLV